MKQSLAMAYALRRKMQNLPTISVPEIDDAPELDMPLEADDVGSELSLDEAPVQDDRASVIKGILGKRLVPNENR